MAKGEWTYRILTDATADLPEGVRAQVDMLPMQLTIGGESFTYCADWDDRRMHAFYQRLRNGEVPSTSQITPFAYEEAFSKPLSCGQDALYFCFSSGLSDTIESAQLAMREVREKFPERRFELIDSLTATFSMGMLIEKAVENREKGMSFEDNIAYLRAHLQKNACWFTVSDLMYLRQGGRISAATAVLGTTLRIMPILHIDETGHLPVVDKVRGRKSAMNALVKQMKGTITDPAGQRVCVGHIDCPEDAQTLCEMVKAAIPDLGGLFMKQIGPIVGAHAGPGTLCVVFFAGER